jgi:hypothetical protein
MVMPKRRINPIQQATLLCFRNNDSCRLSRFVRWVPIHEHHYGQRRCRNPDPTRNSGEGELTPKTLAALTRVNLKNTILGPGG